MIRTFPRSRSYRRGNVFSKRSSMNPQILADILIFLSRRRRLLIIQLEFQIRAIPLRVSSNVIHPIYLMYQPFSVFPFDAILKEIICVALLHVFADAARVFHAHAKNINGTIRSEENSFDFLFPNSFLRFGSDAHGLN